MITDIENMLIGFLNIILFLSWFCMFGVGLYIFVLWIKLTKDSIKERGAIAQFFPIFIFSSSALSDKGKIDKAMLFKIFPIFILLIVLSVVLLFASQSWPDIKLG